MIEKHQTIIHFIETLKLHVDFNLVELVDYWDGDLCAIGLKRKNRLAYVSSYNFLDRSEYIYDYDLELINGNVIDDMVIYKEGRCIYTNDIIFDIKSFLAI